MSKQEVRRPNQGFLNRSCHESLGSLANGSFGGLVDIATYIKQTYRILKKTHGIET
jgi:hypothetical protein